VGKPRRRTSFRILRTRRFRRAFVKDAGPPRGHPASNGRAFDGAPPALVTRQPRSRFRVTVGELPQLYRLADSPVGQTSDTLRLEGTIETVPFRTPRPDPPPRVNADGFPRPESGCLLSEKPGIEVSFEALLQGGRPPLANGSGHRTFSSMVRKPRLDPGDAPLSRAPWGRMRFYDFCK